MAALLLGDGDAVTLNALGDELWGGDQPQRPAAVIRTYVSRLRRVLGGDAIETVSGGAGYRIPRAAADVDLGEFRALVHTACCRRDSGDPAGAVDALREALALYTGHPLSGTGRVVVGRHRNVLESLRLDALELCLVLEVSLGRHYDAIAELVALAVDRPLNERVIAACVLGLHRSGRTGEALQLYHRTCSLLREDFGIDPGPALRDAFGVALGRHPGRPARRPVGGMALPSDVRRLRGREQLVDSVRAQLTEHRAVLVSGMPGVGKSALAVHVAHGLADEFPDGVVYLDLQGHSEGRRPLTAWEAVTALLRRTGGEEDPADSLEDRRHRLADALARQTALLVLDDVSCALSIDDLVPSAGGSRVLLTSRSHAGAGQVPVVTPGVLDVDDGVGLLHDLVGPEQLQAGSTAAVVRWCTGLPLALAIAAARLQRRRAWTTAHLAERLADETRRLRELAVDGRDVAAAVLRSCSGLGRAELGALQVLADVRGPTHIDDIAEALGVAAVEAEATLERLLGRHLVQQDGPETYHLNELVGLTVRRTNVSGQVVADLAS